ncbi:MAG TPA: hypothetical protein VFV39_00200 [Limnobacter sp.]|nr:hypothetical protein [Limnobacter sp.]
MNWVLVCMVFGLGACASTYRVSPVVAPDQVPVFEQAGDMVRSSKKHVVELGAVRADMRQFDMPRFFIRFKNQGKNPLEFSSENVSVTFNDSPARVLSYEAQIQDVQNRLSYYGMRAPVFLQPSYHPFFGAYRGGFVFVDDFNDRLDVQQALADLDYIQNHSLKPKVVRPGDEVAGEIVIGTKLAAGRSQTMVVNVAVDGENHQFTFGYDQMQR